MSNRSFVAIEYLEPSRPIHPIIRRTANFLFTVGERSDPLIKLQIIKVKAAASRSFHIQEFLDID